MPILVDDAWLGWPRGVILEWADPAVRKRLSMTSPSGYAPFERAAARPGNGPAHPDKAGKL